MSSINIDNKLTVRPGAPVVILLPTGRLIHSFDHGGLVKQDDPRLAVLRIPSIVKVAEVDVRHALVRLEDNAHADVAVLLVLPAKTKKRVITL